MRAFFLFLAMFLAMPATAQLWPGMLHDVDCTDDNDPVTAGKTMGLMYVQDVVGGGSDGLCDADLRVTTGALTVDTTFGPIPGSFMTPYGGFIQGDADTTSGGDGNWNLEVWVHSPITGAAFLWFTSVAYGATSNVILPLGPVNTSQGSTNEVVSAIPEEFYIVVDLNTATNWTGSVGLIPGAR
jgi:hypothetical protein